ncbi:MAG: ABC transporter ATP-binding protein [Armatimonadota bacterium]|nr:ABC transporter ATP-binding protein [Armatimonadota bacterium]MDR7485912.1 ABC transporter ATP-binding protein [Armatimonadota bacterium]MDR7533137.1 ABC transporter ATP-binding protein [Armatimonadota bacterium]MDR7536617.1 ABC transporter ATP-binding protein [Armatimonadota bacterium]
MVRAVDDVTLAARRGEFVAVAGPSGCGKTTLLKSLAGLILPERGEIRVDGTVVSGPTRRVGMAFQNPILLPWRRTLDNVLLPLELVAPHRARFRRERRAYAARAQALLAAVGLEGYGDRHPWQLSGGQQQRASLCRALIHDPDLLLLDEPFGALDAFTREELWLVLQDLWLQQRFTVFLVTHDLREAVFLADTVYVMSPRPGRIVARTEVALPRPRTLEDAFTPAFTDLYHAVRRHIGTGRPPDRVPAGLLARGQA